MNITQEELAAAIEAVISPHETHTNAMTAVELAKALKRSERTMREQLKKALERGAVVRVKKIVNGRGTAAYLPKDKDSWV